MHKLTSLVSIGLLCLLTGAAAAAAINASIQSAVRVAAPDPAQTIKGMNGIIHASRNSDHIGGSMNGFVLAPMIGYQRNSDQTG